MRRLEVSYEERIPDGIPQPRIWLLTEVENGETIVVMRHGRPIARVSPVKPAGQPSRSWKRPTRRLTRKGAELASAILEERERESVS